MSSTTGSRNAARTIVLCAVLVVLSSMPVVALGDGVAAGAVSTGHDESGSVLFQQNNSTIHHANPDQVDKNGNLSGVRNWLSRKMGETLIDCTEGLPARKYGACGQLDKKYPEWLSKHVDVNREIESESSGNNGEEQDNETEENTSKSFDHAKENQQQFVSIIQKFNKTRREYQNARENGSTQRARARGRELIGLARRTRNVSANLTANYRTIGNVSRTNVTGGITTINNTTENISAIVRNISAEQFVNTTVTADTAHRRISYLRPLSVSGELTDENGTPLSGKRIILRVGNYSRKTTTAESGEFLFTYRPALVSLSTQQATIRYVPKDLSPYLSNETAVPISIKQVKPTVNLSVRPNRAGFNDSVTVTGRVSAGDIGVSSVPLAVSVDGRHFKNAAQITSASEGLFRGNARLPADVPAGNRMVRVSLPLEGRALAGATTTDTITVVPTPTELSIHAPRKYAVNRSNETDRVISVGGQLRVENGTTIPDRSIELRLNGTTVGKARTNQNGTYAANLSIPQRLLAGLDGATPVTLVAVYDGQGTSFKASRARTQITITPPEQTLLQQLLDLFGELSFVYQLLLGTVLVLLGGFLLYVLGRRYTAGDTNTPSSDVSEPESMTSSDDDRGEISLIEMARRQLTAGDTDQAVLTAYAALRDRLSDMLGLASAQTHREFLAACRERIAGKKQFGFLERITEAYERAAFAPQTTSEKVSTGAIKDAQQLENEAVANNSSDNED